MTWCCNLHYTQHQHDLQAVARQWKMSHVLSNCGPCVFQQHAQRHAVSMQHTNNAAIMLATQQACRQHLQQTHSTLAVQLGSYALAIMHASCNRKSI